MSDDVWKRQEIESPCIKVCIVHPEAKLCVGCYRNLDEIRDWSKYSPQTRRSVMATLPERAELVKPKRRGGRSRTKPPQL